MGNRTIVESNLQRAVAALQDARRVLGSDGWNSTREADAYFDQLKIELSPCWEAVIARYWQAWPSGANIDSCRRVLRREHISGIGWRDEVDIFRELFPTRAREVWRVPGRARRGLAQADRRGVRAVPIEKAKDLIAELDWIREQVKVNLGIRRGRRRKKALRPAARALDGLLILVRNGSAPGLPTYRFSYSIATGHLTVARARI